MLFTPRLGVTTQKCGKARKGTGTKTGLPFSETGDKTRFSSKKNGTKVERKRGENRVSGSKIQFKAGKGTGTKSGLPFFRNRARNGIKNEIPPGFKRE